MKYLINWDFFDTYCSWMKIIVHKIKISLSPSEKKQQKYVKAIKM